MRTTIADSHRSEVPADRQPFRALDTAERCAMRPAAHLADLIRLAFDLYATGEYTLDALLDELRARGLLRSEQHRIAQDVREVEERLKGVEATLAEWQEVLAIAFKFATNCGRAYRSANARTRKLYNSAVFERLAVRNGEIANVQYREPFCSLFVLPEFEQGRVEHHTFACSNLAAMAERIRPIVGAAAFLSG